MKKKHDSHTTSPFKEKDEEYKVRILLVLVKSWYNDMYSMPIFVVDVRLLLCFVRSLETFSEATAIV